MNVLKEHPIRVFALLCVAVIATYLMWQGNGIINTLSGPSWCRNALGAEKVSPTDGTIKGLDACVGLFTIQLKALANVAYTFAGGLTLSLVALMVIVIAGGRIQFSASKSGASASMSSAEDIAATQAAAQTAGAAIDKAKEIATDGAKPAAPVEPSPRPV